MLHMNVAFSMQIKNTFFDRLNCDAFQGLIWNIIHAGDISKWFATKSQIKFNLDKCSEIFFQLD